MPGFDNHPNGLYTAIGAVSYVMCVTRIAQTQRSHTGRSDHCGPCDPQEVRRGEGTREVEHDELQQLADDLREMVLEGKLGTRSCWALRQMVEAWRGKQLNGIGSVRVESAERGKVEVAFASNATEVSARWEFG